MSRGYNVVGLCGECKHWRPDVPEKEWSKVKRTKVYGLYLRLGKCLVENEIATEREEKCMNGLFLDAKKKPEVEECPAPMLPNCGTETRQSAGCAWCGPGRMGWFSVQFWVRSCHGRRKWMSVTQDWKYKVKFCPMCGRKLEVEG